MAEVLRQNGWKVPNDSFKTNVHSDSGFLIGFLERHIFFARLFDIANRLNNQTLKFRV